MLDPIFIPPASYLRFRQAEEYIERGIESGRFPVGSRLPSVEELASLCGFAPKTIHKAYRNLLLRGVVESVPRKGYYVLSSRTDLQQRVFLLLDSYSPYKQSLFQTIKQGFGQRADLSVHFHGYDPDVFRRYIVESVGKYTTYIISSFYMDDLEEVLGMLPPERLYLLGRHPRNLKQEYHGVFQNFREDVIRGLKTTGDRMWKYDRLVLYFRDSVTRPPKELLDGFLAFCRDRKVEHRVVKADEPVRVQQGEAYILIDDLDLIDAIRQAQTKHYVPGEDFGVISYNDTPIKSIISTTGVSVLSTDFRQMGRSIVEMVLKGRYDHLENPSFFLDRKTF